MTNLQCLGRISEVWNTSYKERTEHGNLKVSGRAESSDSGAWTLVKKMCFPVPSGRTMMEAASSKLRGNSVFIIKQNVLVLMFDQLYNYFSKLNLLLCSLPHYLFKSACDCFLPIVLVITGTHSCEWVISALAKCPSISNYHQHKFPGLACPWVWQLPNSSPFPHCILPAPTIWDGIIHGFDHWTVTLMCWGDTVLVASSDLIHLSHDTWDQVVV